MVSALVALVVTVVILVASWLWAGRVDKQILADSHHTGGTDPTDDAAD